MSLYSLWNPSERSKTFDQEVTFLKHDSFNEQLTQTTSIVCITSCPDQYGNGPTVKQWQTLYTCDHIYPNGQTHKRSNTLVIVYIRSNGISVFCSTRSSRMRELCQFGWLWDSHKNISWNCCSLNTNVIRDDLADVPEVGDEVALLEWNDGWNLHRCRSDMTDFCLLWLSSDFLRQIFRDSRFTRNWHFWKRKQGQFWPSPLILRRK